MGKGDTPKIVEAQQINKWYRTPAVKFHALKDVDLMIREGEFVAIMGPSGSGKSTLMNIIGCLDNYDSGQYFLNGKDIQELQDKELAYYRGEIIGFIFQSFNLVDRYSVLDNVVMPSLYVPVENRKEKAKKLLERVGLGDKLQNKPLELSGGQRQRVAIARSLISDPKLILADEPTGNLDSESSREIMKLLKELKAEGRTIVLITHDQETAKFADRVVKIVDGELKNE